MEIPFDPSDETLKCSICNKPLSIPPILHSTSMGYICGRCEQKAIASEKNGDSPLERQRIYENIAKYITFPCAYEVLGCTTQLKWESVQNHEDNCEFKNIVCPLSHENFQEQCAWIGEHNQLIAHIKKDHKKFFSNPPQTILTHEFGSKILFWEITGRIVVIIFDYKKNVDKYFCCISADLNRKDCLKYEYQVKMYINQGDDPVIVQRDQLEPLYGNTSTRPDNSLEINIDSFRHLFEKSNEVTVKFTVVQKDGQEIQSTSSASNNLTNNKSSNEVEHALNEDLLRDLECPVCVEFMSPPIYICQAGHNICNNCNGKIDMCPICRGNMLGGRNFTLEKLTATINYPCVNRPHGCAFVHFLPQVKQHENNCLLTQRECFIGNCPWKGANLGLSAHFEESHNFIELNTTHVHQLQKKVDQYIMNFDDRLFLFNVRFDINQPFEYIVQCIGDDDVKYNHELQIIGSSLIDIKITLCHLCQPLAYNTDRKKIRDFKGISIPFSFLSQFLTHFDQLEFKLKIRKINA